MAKMGLRGFWWFVATLATLGWAASPSLALTLEGYFQVLALAAKKRDVWRKIFMGRDIGFDVSPWLFEDRVQPPFVPIVTTFPRHPVHGHYRQEHALPSPQVDSSAISPLLAFSKLCQLESLRPSLTIDLPQLPYNTRRSGHQYTRGKINEAIAQK